MVKRIITSALLVPCALGLLLPGVGSAQSRGAYTDVKKLPEGYAGERINELLSAINANDPEQVKTFMSQSVDAAFRDMAPMSEHQAIFADVFNQSRGLEFYGIRNYDDPTPEDEVVAIVRNKLTQSWNAIVLRIQVEPPHKITRLQYAPARLPTGLPEQSALSEADISTELGTFVTRLAEADAFSGTVLLAKQDKVIYKGAFGLASKRFSVPNHIDTKFNLGSVNKMFTGVAITQLVQAGKISLDDPLSKFASTDWLPHDISKKILVKHLLTHTSGLGSYFNRTYMESSKALFRELDDYKPLISDSTLSFEPGSDYRYSNTGMFMLGVVIESASGKNYFDYIREHIAKPAGMINTDCYEMDKPVPNLAIGYSRESGPGGAEWTNNIYKHVLRGGPAGGGFSTVEDLWRFDMALRNNKLLDAKHTEMVWSGKPELNSPDYGFGFSVDGTPQDRIVGHGGGFSGISSNLDMFLGSGYTAVVMSNYDRGSSAIQDKMRELIGRLQ